MGAVSTHAASLHSAYAEVYRFDARNSIFSLFLYILPLMAQRTRTYTCMYMHMSMQYTCTPVFHTSSFCHLWYRTLTKPTVKHTSYVICSYRVKWRKQGGQSPT